jgi:protocatechuate 3,4-dioxygenase beta subunit
MAKLELCGGAQSQNSQQPNRQQSRPSKAVKVHRSYRDTARAALVPAALLLFAAPAIACSCFSNATICSEIMGSYPVFVALVLQDSGEGWGKGPSRLRLEERLVNATGLPAEIDIDTAAGTSCYRPLRTGERYVIFAKPHPAKGADWTVGGCNSTFLLRGNQHRLDALRNAARQGPARLFGAVRLQESDGVGNRRVPGAVVTVISPDGEQAVIADSEGVFVVPGILPGRYRVTVAKPGLLPDDAYNGRWSGRFVQGKTPGRLERDPEDAANPVLIKERACTEWSLALWPDHSLSGRVTDEQGAPLQNITVQAFTFDKRGDQEPWPFRTAKTNALGEYTLRPLPEGEYLVGVNAGLYEDASPHPRTEAPGRIRIAEGQPSPTVNLTLPAQRQATTLRVVVVGSDGAPIPGASVTIANPDRQFRSSSNKTTAVDGVFTATVYRGDSYEVEVHYTPAQRDGFDYLGATVPITATTLNPEVRAVLSPQRYLWNP